jgi:transcriptional regulator with XRE-family HTH domain
MAELNTHWTEKSTNDFLYRIGADFVSRIERLLGTQSKASLAKKLGVTGGRISQVLNNPGNLRLKTMIEYARALGLKISVVTYDDNDPENLNGPVDAEIFEQCWVRTGKPLDFFALQAATPPTSDQFTFVIMPCKQRAAVASGFRHLSEKLTGEEADTSEASSKWNLFDKGGFYGRSDTNRL